METKGLLLPELNRINPVEGKLIQKFRNDGYVYLPALANPSEVAAYREVIKSTAMEFNNENRPLEERDM